MTIARFDKTNLRDVRATIDNALREALAAHGITPDVGTIRFDARQARLTLTLNVNATSAEAAAEKSATQARALSLLGLPADTIGKVFYEKGAAFRVVDVAPSRPRYPIVAVRIHDDRRFKFPAYILRATRATA